MTANQLGYAANLETARHNRATEAEIAAHDRTTEDLAAQSNRIQDDKNRIQEQYNRDITDIQRRYNDTYLELQRSQGDRRLDIQQQLADIENEKKDITKSYNSQMIELRGMEIGNENLKIQETNRHNQRLEELENRGQLFTREVALKRAEYERTSQREANLTREVANLINFKETKKRMELIEAQKNVAELEAKYMLSTKTSQALSGIGAALRGLGGVASLFMF